jgi:predicted transposase/invertase (TIGR01784 family)
LTEINENTEKAPQELLDNELTREAVEYMEIAAYTKDQLDTYDQWKINIMTEKGLLSSAKNEGKAEGIQEGRRKGIQEGRKEGKTERNIEIAKQAKAMKMDIVDIAKLTGLSEVEIKKL